MAFPKNIIYYQADTSAVTPHGLEAGLQKLQFSPCGTMDWFSRGFVPPAPDSESLAHNVDDEFILVTLRSQEKRIPASVIREKLDEMVKAMESRESRRVGKKEKQQLREQITDGLLPTTQPISMTIRAWIDLARNRLMIEAGSAAKAELMIGMLREACPPFPARLPRTNLTPASQMTGWLAGEAPPNFTLDADCELKAPGEGAVVRFSRQDLSASEVRAHLEREMVATKLGMTWCDRISFVMTESGLLRKVSITDVVNESVDGEDAADVFRSEQSIFTQEMRNLLDALEEALGGVEQIDAPF